MLAQKTCFVVMGFGRKTDFETGRNLDLDKTYRNIIKPAVEAAGLTCLRADGIVHSGPIDVPMYKQLLNADVVIADVSTANANAFYELGVRHALRPCTTLVIAEDGVKKFPFDINHVVVRQYHHLGEGIDFDEVERFRGELTTTIQTILAKNPLAHDSPVYTFLRNLTPPSLPKAPDYFFIEERNPRKSASSNPWWAKPEPLRVPSMTRSQLLEEAGVKSRQVEWLTDEADGAALRGDLLAARNLFAAARAMTQDDDPFIVQQLALFTYKSKLPTPLDALREAQNLLAVLNPATTKDPETLYIWGSIHKRLWDANRQPTDLDEAIRAYRTSYSLRNDTYSGIHLAYVYNLRGSQATDPAEAIADFVLARRIRRDVRQQREQWLADHPQSGGETEDTHFSEEAQRRYWTLVNLAEACIGLGEETEGDRYLAGAFAMRPGLWHENEIRPQLDRLRQMVADSPLKYLTSASN
ncbi:MAG: hypothetical protein LH606_16080 [Cytophagaceae bacterium]|nr:hypothetical protein [Cytophagaceae bacterium]